MGGGAGGSLMMIGMGIVWLLTIAVLVLGIAALVKYLRSDSGRTG
jgi:Na+-transporting methylmalonyl-CoA/oxaloacetate decarboxylase gamma subunit